MSSRRDWTRETLLEGIRAGDRRALARAITLVESSDPLAYDLVRELYPQTGRAYVLGLTGPPGVGKSSLIGALLTHVRGLGQTAGVVSVDPSSPFSRGALLGDRIRLSDHFLDPGVFIRSMGTRGHVGGLSEATLQAALLLDAAGKDLVFVETVGTGQSEIEVIGVADTVLLVLMPGSGDSIQALKAGIMEIPDVIAINKMDHPAARTMLNEVRSVLALDRERAWKVPIVLTEAQRGENVAELWAKIGEHRAYLERDGLLEERRRRNLAGEVFAVASARAKAHLQHAVAEDPELRRLLDEVADRELDPLSAVREIVEKVFRIDGEVDPAEISLARERIHGIARVTPVYGSETLSRLAGRPVHLKAENLQRTGSFKIRGAVNKLATLDEPAARGGRRRGERRQPRAGGGLGGAGGRDPGDDLRPPGRADGEGRGDEELRRRRGDGRGGARGGDRRRRRRTSRRAVRRSSTPTRTRPSSPARGRSGSSSTSRFPRPRPCSSRSAAVGSRRGSGSPSAGRRA